MSQSPVKENTQLKAEIRKLRSEKNKERKTIKHITVDDIEEYEKHRRARQAAEDRRVAKTRKDVEHSLRESSLRGEPAVKADELWLRALCMPSQATGACIPDDFPDDTVRYGSTVLMNVGALGGAGFTFDPAGVFGAFLTPDLRKHYYFTDSMQFAPEETGDSSPSNIYSLGTWQGNCNSLVRNDGDYDGLRATAYSDARVSSALTHVASATLDSAIFPVDWARNDYPVPVTSPNQITDAIIFPLASANGVVAAGIPVFPTVVTPGSSGLVAGTGTEIWVSATVPAVQVNTAAEVAVVLWGYDDSGVYGSQESAAQLTLTGSTFTIVTDVGDNTRTAFNLVRLTGVQLRFYQHGSPDFETLGISQLSIGMANVIGSGTTDANNPFVLANFGKNYSYTSANSTAAHTIPFPSLSVWSSRAVPEYTAYNNGLCSAYRLVGASIWGEYTGSDLNNSGQILHLLNDSRRPPAGTNFDYLSTGGLAAVNGAYDGLLKVGQYAIWKPKAHRDLAWRTFDQQWKFELPYNTVIYTNPLTAGQSLRMRLVARWEVQSLSNVLNKQPSRIDPEEVLFTLRVLQGLPPCMENSFHFSDIGNFFKNAVGVAKQVLPRLAPVVSQAAMAMGKPGIAAGVNGLTRIVGAL